MRKLRSKLGGFKKEHELLETTKYRIGGNPPEIFRLLELQKNKEYLSLCIMKTKVAVLSGLWRLRRG